MAHTADDRKHVLIVDDDPDTLELLCTLLDTNGYSAVGVSNANAAVENVRQRVPDLLLIDYMLPEIDGMIDSYEHKIGPRNGARVVAKAWVNAEYKKRLLADGTTAIAELGYAGLQGEHMAIASELNNEWFQNSL